eukprot:975110_1
MSTCTLPPSSRMAEYGKSVIASPFAMLAPPSISISAVASNFIIAIVASYSFEIFTVPPSHPAGPCTTCTQILSSVLRSSRAYSSPRKTTTKGLGQSIVLRSTVPLPSLLVTVNLFVNRRIRPLFRIY